VPWSTQLAGPITYLTNGIASSDFAPTTQPLEVHRRLEERVRRHRTEIGAPWSRDLAEIPHDAPEEGDLDVDVVAKTPGRGLTQSLTEAGSLSRQLDRSLSVGYD